MSLRHPAGRILLGGAFWFLSAAAAQAELCHAGYTGLISTPTPEVEPDGRLSFGFSWIDGPRTYLFAPKTNRVYAATMGVLPGLELTFRQTQVVGWVDPDAPGVAYAFDRMGSAKYQLPLPAGFPKLAAGVQDFASVGYISGIPGMTPEGTKHGQSTLYLVVGDHSGPLDWLAGVAKSQSFLNGAFWGLGLRLPFGFSLMAEHDSRQFNCGLRFAPLSGVAMQASSLGGDTTALSLQLAWRL